jgi:ATP-binding cassette subfamily G (WHITE) protein 2 (PDR)
LLDVLATRDTIGVVSGEALVDGHHRDISFQRKTGYAQQADIHLETMTVREAFRFNAIMCQPANLTRKQKLDYVEGVISLLGMEEYADATVGVPGEGRSCRDFQVLETDSMPRTECGTAKEANYWS